MPHTNHYKVLGVSHWATVSQINAAWARIVQDNDPYNIRLLGPSARAKAEQLVKEATAARAILADPHSRRKYNDTLPSAAGSAPPESSVPPPPRTPPPPPPPSGSASDSYDPIPNDEADKSIYRYKSSQVGTIVEISICGWRFKLSISSRFEFEDNLTELRKHENGATSVSFELGLKRDTQSDEYRTPTIKELAVMVTYMPPGLRIISLKSIFKETPSTSTLALTLIAETCTPVPFFIPWDYAFDFDLNERVRAQNRATHLIFTKKEPSQRLKDVHEAKGGPEYELKRDEDLSVDSFAYMREERCMKVGHGDLEMWRLAAVGFKKPIFFYRTAWT
ncbi:hypothetical protein K505DRAFT_252384 [Melanomma pulvis-pyrius CBS 109.77]|uniref:J domain-containing protein n=1 Tax=Melanomma pulvis-pyrius CBS 109.77 TaxID=1314802 RepID=A0A6A6X109_9PLEO|nr:hypothetical protein K505DRAFT_252384 [Melanomma pulvis-pyrius CBS 109.77]